LNIADVLFFEINLLTASSQASWEFFLTHQFDDWKTPANFNNSLLIPEAALTSLSTNNPAPHRYPYFSVHFVSKATCSTASAIFY
jgi:hypothetical protein